MKVIRLRECSPISTAEINETGGTRMVDEAAIAHMDHVADDGDRALLAEWAAATIRHECRLARQAVRLKIWTYQVIVLWLGVLALWVAIAGAAGAIPVLMLAGFALWVDRTLTHWSEPK